MKLKEICKDIAMSAFNVGDILGSIKNTNIEYIVNKINDDGITVVSNKGMYTYFIYKNEINFMHKL